MLLRRAVEGTVAGLVATVPMTAVMAAGHALLPRRERYPLHPRLITERLLARAGMRHRLRERERQRLTMAAHFGYGAAMGPLYSLAVRRLPLPPAVSGALFGLGVYAASYFGVLPALQVLRPANEHPRGRNQLLIGAHLVYGAALGLLAEALPRLLGAEPRKKEVEAMRAGRPTPSYSTVTTLEV